MALFGLSEVIQLRGVTLVTGTVFITTHPEHLSFIKVWCVAIVLGCASQSFAVTYIVPPDRFEIERASAIVVGRVLGSHVQASRFGIEKVTTIALEEAIKGQAGSIVKVHEPGGILDGEVRIVPGVPAFADGERVLLDGVRLAAQEFAKLKRAVKRGRRIKVTRSPEMRECRPCWNRDRVWGSTKSFCRSGRAGWGRFIARTIRGYGAMSP